MTKYTVYLFYLKKTGELYAFTTVKEYKDNFLRQRCKDCFYMKKVKMKEPVWQVFSSNQHLKMLNEYPLNVSMNDYVMVMSTPEEDDKLVERCSVIEHKMEDLYREIVVKSKLKKKYKKIASRLCEVSYLKDNKDGTKENVSTMNLFKVFYETFSDTFQERDLEES